MAYNFLRAARDQPFLFPPDLRDWLPQEHLAWFILDVVDQREDELFGDARGDELPPELASKADRLARLRQAKAQLEAEAAAREQAYQQRVAAHTAAAEAKGRKPRTLKRRPQETPNPEATANVTDPCSRFLHTRNGTVQGYNAQASRPWSR